MKATFVSTALAVLAGSTVVAAQSDGDYTTSPPFHLKISAPDNSTIDGRFLYACHTGAGTSTLCVGQLTPTTSETSAQFYLNHTASNPNGGYLINNLELHGSDSVTIVPQPFRLVFSPATNVAMTWFSPGAFTYGETVTVKFTSDGLSLPIYPVDSDFREGVRPNPAGRDASNWYTCYVLAGSYYYNALAWVSAGIPSNPTCRPVKVVKVDVQA